MANESKWAPVYDADRRPVSQATIEELENVGVQFNAYGVEKNQLLTIDPNPEVVKQAPRREGQRPTFLVACKRNGIKSWFNPLSLLTLDADLNPVYPAWAALGGAKAVVEKIVSMKSGIKTSDKTFQKMVTAFNRDGSIKEVVVRDEKDEIVLNEDGTPKMTNGTKSRDFVEVPDPKE